MDNLENSPDYRQGLTDGRAEGFDLAWKWHDIFLDAITNSYERKIKTLELQLKANPNLMANSATKLERGLSE